MKNRPKVSIITVCFNSGNDLEKTIRSVLEQDYNKYEYIIIDGGSKDGTRELLEKYSENIAYWVSEPDEGIYNAMNKGAKVARGEYLYFLNAGDVFSDRDVLNKVDVEDSDLIYGKIRVVNKENDDSYVRDRTLTKFNLRFGNKVSQQAVFIKKEIFDKVGGLNEKYKIASDFDLLCKVFEKDYSINKIDLIICDYDRDGFSSNLTRSYRDTGIIIKDRYGVLYYCVYFIITRFKLLVSNILKIIEK